MSELLPCPFCGGDASHGHITYSAAHARAGTGPGCPMGVLLGGSGSRYRNDRLSPPVARKNSVRFFKLHGDSWCVETAIVRTSKGGIRTCSSPGLRPPLISASGRMGWGGVGRLGRGLGRML